MICKNMEPKPALYTGLWHYGAEYTRRNGGKSERFFKSFTPLNLYERAVRRREQNMNACSVLWCGEYRQNWENDPHNHTFFQLFAFSEGSCQIMIENDDFPVSPQQIYLVLPQQFHAIHAAPNHFPHILDIKFSVQSQPLFEDLTEISLPFVSGNYSWYVHCFEKIIQESTKRQKYYYPTICNHLFEMLVNLIREASDDEPALQSKNLEHTPVQTYRGVDVAALMEYIQVQYSHIISLDDMALAAHATKTTLTNMFKELYNTTPIRYVNSIRMQKARELLVNTDTSIGDIAELVGFQSIHYFSRYFKSKENCTPIEYRMLNSRNRYFTFP